MLSDLFNRRVNYLRVSVTDRCDLRCQYCMKENPEFLPKNEILTLEELERLCDIFIEQGIEKTIPASFFKKHSVKNYLKKVTFG